MEKQMLDANNTKQLTIYSKQKEEMLFNIEEGFGENVSVI